jgi:hypothetical protein
MSNVIAFLENMGQNAQLRHAPQSEVQLALTRTKIDPELQAVILAKDQKQLEALMGGLTNVCCMLDCDMPGEDELCLEQCA